MARVLIEGNAVDIRVSLLERLLLAERSRKVPLAQIRRVDPHPPLLDMMMHWSDQSGSWLCGVSSYDGHMVPSARHPSSTLAIEINGEQCERIYIEIDDESPTMAAERIERALFAIQASLTRGAAHVDDGLASEFADLSCLHARTNDPRERDNRRSAALEALDVELEDEEIRLRDPLMQGSLPPGPMILSQPVPELKLEGDRDLTRLGSWLVGTGSLGLLAGGVMLATGALPGLFAVGAGVAAALLGGVALAVVAHHQS